MSATIHSPLAVEMDPARTHAATMSRAVVPLCAISAGRFIIAPKRWFMTASCPSTRNMQSPCGMLLSAVSNWPASAASRSRATTAPMKMRCRFTESCMIAIRNAPLTTAIAM
ncbi:hypothetical protein ACVWWK_000535 [Bradyrhizobium sp. LB9.1b]